MGRIVRAAAYVPVHGTPERAVLGPDEDRFTLAATAVERAAGADPFPIAPVTIELVGEGGGAMEWGFGPLLGVETRVRVHEPGTGSIEVALGDALRGTGASIVVVADPGTGPRGPGSSGGVGAVAFLVVPGDRSSSGIGELPLSAGPPRAPLAAALHWRAGRPASEDHCWVGDWGTGPPRGGAPDPEGRAPMPPSASVSEGAYLPKPRYLEGLPSRWRFEGERCGSCGTVGFPARGRCRGCLRGDRLETVRFPRDGGTVLATTWIGRGGQPTEFDPQVETTGPYGVALVELASEVRVTLQLTDCDPGQVRLGDRVGTRLRRIYSLEGEWRYGRKAIPLPPAPPP